MKKDIPQFFPTQFDYEGYGKKSKRIQIIIDKGGTAYVYLDELKHDITEDMVFKFYKDCNGVLRCFRRFRGKEQVELEFGSDDRDFAYNDGEPITEDEYYRF